MSCRSLLPALAVLTLMAGCTPTPAPDFARMPDGALSPSQDPDTSALNLMVYDFADASRTHGNAVEGARAVASLDYMAGRLYEGPRWDRVSPIWKHEMVEGRQELRAALGIVPNATSQAVVDAMIGVANAMLHSDTKAALAILAQPIFTLGPQETLNRITNLPFLSDVNIATMHVGASVGESNSN